MFDEPKPNKPITSSKEPEDIFSKTEPVSNNAPANLPVSPMLPNQGKPAAEHKKTEPVSPSSAGGSQLPPTAAVPSIAHRSKAFKIFLGLLIAILVILILSVSGWFVYNKFFTVRMPSVNINKNLNSEINLNNTNSQPANEAARPQKTAQPIDSDGDGLTDEEEMALGTDPNNTDTDGDGLFDYEEVKVYNTDPLNPDSDGDKYLDGEEVKNGYNPLGPGKLLNFNQNKNNQ